MKLILYQATIAITEIDFVPGPFRCQIELGHLYFAVVSEVMNFFFAEIKHVLHEDAGLELAVMPKRLRICLRICPLTNSKRGQRSSSNVIRPWSPGFPSWPLRTIMKYSQ